MYRFEALAVILIVFLQMAVANATEPTRFFKVSGRPVMLTPISSLNSGVIPLPPRVDTIPVSLTSDDEIDETSLLFRSLDSLRSKSSEPARVQVGLETQFGHLSGWISLSRSEQINVAFNFLKNAEKTYSIDHFLKVLDRRMTDSTLMYLSQFFPEAALKAEQMHRLVKQSGLNELVQQLKFSRVEIETLTFALTRLERLIIFVEGTGQLIDMSVLDDPKERKRFSDHIRETFMQTLESFRRVLPKDEVKIVAVNEAPELYLTELADLVDRSLLETPSKGARVLVGQIMSEQLAETERLMTRNPFSLPKSFSLSKKIFRDSIPVLSLASFAAFHGDLSITASAFFLSLWTTFHARDRDTAVDQHRILRAICPLEMEKL